MINHLRVLVFAVVSSFIKLSRTVFFISNKSKYVFNLPFWNFVRFAQMQVDLYLGKAFFFIQNKEPT